MTDNYDEQIEQALENARRLGINPIDLTNVTPVATPVTANPIPENFEDISSYTNPDDQIADQNEVLGRDNFPELNFDNLDNLPEVEATPDFGVLYAGLNENQNTDSSSPKSEILPVDNEQEPISKSGFVFHPSDDIHSNTNEDKNLKETNLDDTKDNSTMDFGDLDLLSEEDNNTIDFDGSIEVGDIVNLEPEISDLLNNYDPDDVFKLEAIDGAIGTLSRNGENIPELAAIPLNKLTKVNEFDDIMSSSDKKTDKEDIPVIQKGAKPIRWSSRFIDKIRKNTSVEEINKKLEASQEKDEEKAENKEMPKGTIVSFKTSLLSHQLNFAKKSSNRWNKIKGYFNKNDEADKQEETELENDTAKKVEEDINNNSKENENQGPINPTSNTDNKEDVAYEWFMAQSKDSQKNMLVELFTQLDNAQKQLTEATEALSDANDKIEELTKQNVQALADGKNNSEQPTNDGLKPTVPTPVIDNDTNSNNDDLLARLAELEKENAEMKNKNQQLADENAQVKADNQQLTEKKNESNNADLIARLAELEKENAEMKNENQQLVEKNSSLSKQNYELESSTPEYSHFVVDSFHGEDEPALSPRAQAWLEQAEQEKAEQRRLEKEVQEKLKQLNAVTASQSAKNGSPYVPYTEESFTEESTKTR